MRRAEIRTDTFFKRADLLLRRFSCFERFFRHVNCKEGKLIAKRRGGYFMDDLSLVGVEYLWKV